MQWHFTFMWIFVGSGLMYVIYQIATGHWRQVLFMPRDIKGVWPMARHYFLFGKKPPVDAAYNPLQKLAYTSTIFFGVMSTLTGMVMYKPVQFWWLAWPMGGYHYRPHLAFHLDVRIRGLHPRTPDHGAAAWLEQLLFHDYRLEARSGISGVRAWFTTETRRSELALNPVRVKATQLSSPPVRMIRRWDCHPQ